MSEQSINQSTVSLFLSSHVKASPSTVRSKKILYTSPDFTDKIKNNGLLPKFGTIFEEALDYLRVLGDDRANRIFSSSPNRIKSAIGEFHKIKRGLEIQRSRVPTTGEKPPAIPWK